jgi:hypothetical protein
MDNPGKLLPKPRRSAPDENDQKLRQTQSQPAVCNFAFSFDTLQTPCGIYRFQTFDCIALVVCLRMRFAPVVSLRGRFASVASLWRALRACRFSSKALRACRFASGALRAQRYASGGASRPETEGGTHRTGTILIGGNWEGPYPSFY